jgi:hypothetical protein
MINDNRKVKLVLLGEGRSLTRWWVHERYRLPVSSDIYLQVVGGGWEGRMLRWVAKCTLAVLLSSHNSLSACALLKGECFYLSLR